MSVLKQCIGIDCAKQTLDACFSVLDVDFNVVELATSVFTNDVKGCKQLLSWAAKLKADNAPLLYVLEATGTYHEHLAHYVSSQGCDLAIVLPSLAHMFSRTLKKRTVTDKQSSRMLALLGLERKLELWQRPEPVYATLRKLCRERVQLLEQSLRAQNQLHATSFEAIGSKTSSRRYKQQIALLQKQVKEIEKEIKELVKNYPDLKARLAKLCTIKGVGFLTAVTIVAETAGFNLIRNKKQLVSYAGYDVVEKRSGSSVRGKARISKRGNSHIRRALHFPALQSVLHSTSARVFYERLYERNKIKMKAYTAIQRKILVLMYTLWKNNTVFEEGYNEKQDSQRTVLHELDHVRP